VLTEKQKMDKIKNLLQSLRKAGIIDTDVQNQRLSNWVLKNDLDNS